MNKEDSFQLEIVLITRDFENLLISPKPNITSQFLKSEVLIVYAVRQTWAGLASRVSVGLSQVISEVSRLAHDCDICRGRLLQPRSAFG